MDKILLSIADSPITVREITHFIERCSQEYPDYEVFMDGDAYAIVARPRHAKYIRNKTKDYKSMLGMIA